MKVTSHTTIAVTKEKKLHYLPPGTVVELEKEEALDLIQRGIAVSAEPPKDKPVDKDKPTDPASDGKKP